MTFSLTDITSSLRSIDTDIAFWLEGWKCRHCWILFLVLLTCATIYLILQYTGNLWETSLGRDHLEIKIFWVVNLPIPQSSPIINTHAHIHTQTTNKQYQINTQTIFWSTEPQRTNKQQQINTQTIFLATKPQSSNEQHQINTPSAPINQ